MRGRAHVLMKRSVPKTTQSKHSYSQQPVTADKSEFSSFCQSSPFLHTRRSQQRGFHHRCCHNQLWSWPLVWCTCTALKLAKVRSVGAQWVNLYKALVDYTVDPAKCDINERLRNLQKNYHLEQHVSASQKKKRKKKREDALSSAVLFQQQLFNSFKAQKKQQKQKNKKTPGNHVKAAFSPRTHLSITMSVDALCK